MAALLLAQLRPRPGSGPCPPLFGDRFPPTTRSAARGLPILVFLQLLLHLLCLPGAVVRGLDVQHERTNSGTETRTTGIAAWEKMSNKVEDYNKYKYNHSMTFTGTKEETPVTTTSPVRRLRQEENKEPAQQVGPSATSRETSPTSTDPSRDRRSQLLEAEDAEGYQNPTQYLVLEANGVGGGGEGLTPSKREITSAAHADRRGWGQPVPTVDGDGESERDTSRDLRKPPHLRQPIGGSYSHFVEQARRGSYASAATVGGDAARLESRSGSWGAASRHTSGPLTVDAATASSEYGGRPAENLIDGDISDTSFAHTSLALPSADDKVDGVGQRCPWWQLDLGATKAVDKVKLTAPKRFKRMRRLLFVEPIDGRNYVRWYGTDMEGGRPGGVRVLVGNSARNRADTSQLLPDGRWSGNAVGPICTEPATGEECETIQCDDPTTCLDRFAEESNAPAGIGTAEVDCNGKQGRYVTIELPGVTAHDTDLIRTGGFTEVRIEGGPLPVPAAAQEETGLASINRSPFVSGGVVVLALVVAGVGLWFALGNSQTGPGATDAAVEPQPLAHEY